MGSSSSQFLHERDRVSAPKPSVNFRTLYLLKRKQYPIFMDPVEDLQLLLSLPFSTSENAMVDASDPEDPFGSPLRVEPATSSEMKSFLPNVDNEKCPKLGMFFSTIDEAFDFYNTYTKDAGFSVRKSSEKKRIDATTKEKYIYWKIFVCSKEGHSVEKPGSNIDYERRVMETQESCIAEF